MYVYFFLNTFRSNKCSARLEFRTEMYVGVRFHRPDDGVSMHLSNVGQRQRECMAVHPRRL
jgi:hypothetical protein